MITYGMENIDRFRTVPSCYYMLYCVVIVSLILLGVSDLIFIMNLLAWRKKFKLVWIHLSKRTEFSLGYFCSLL